MAHRGHARTPASRRKTERPLLLYMDRPAIVYCRRCWARLYDCEPFNAGEGEFWHPKNDCPNTGRVMIRGTGGRGLTHWRAEGEYTVYMPKQPRRARDRGARLAAKMRPR